MSTLPGLDGVLHAALVAAYEARRHARDMVTAKRSADARVVETELAVTVAKRAVERDLSERFGVGGEYLL